MKINEIIIKPPFIKLEQFLKFTALCETGGHAKIIINGGEVCVNGEICEMRGKKLYNGDIITIKDVDEAFKVVLNDNQED